MKLIGLGYKAKSGKDTVASLLRTRHGYTRVAFADKLKESARVVLGLSHEQLHGGLKETVDPYWGFTPRWALERMGDGFRQLIDSEVWIKALMRDLSGSDVYRVITDVRYPNEAAAIKRLGGVVVRVDREGSGASGGVAGHPTDTVMDAYTEWDYVVDNNGSLEDLSLAVDRLIVKIAVMEGAKLAVRGA